MLKNLKFVMLFAIGPPITPTGLKSIPKIAKSLIEGKSD